MHTRVRPAESLLGLLRLEDTAERRSCWRQTLAALGGSARVTGPPPLDNVEPQTLLEAVQVALSTGLVDDLDWIAPGQGAVALYELTSALPQSVVRRELGRRVFARLYEGTASTFAMVATRMALASSKSLEAPTMRGRVALLYEMPIGSTVSGDALALALISRQQTFRRWVTDAPVGALYARRLAAKLFEHGAREAVIRDQQGDPWPTRLFSSHEVRPSLSMLLADREPLVWRHAAVARGLLAASDPLLRQEIETSLDPALSPTEWRRASVSLVSLMAFDPDTALKQCLRLIDGPIARQDPGVLAVMAMGLPRVIEVEPDAAEELLNRVAKGEQWESAEATAELLSDVVVPGFGRRAAESLRARVGGHRSPEPQLPLAGYLRQALGFIPQDPSGVSLPESLREALVAYETQGARAAHALARATLSDALTSVDRLAGFRAQQGSFDDLMALVSDLDAAVLKRSALWGLLLLNRSPGDVDPRVSALKGLHERLGTVLLDIEARHRERAPDDDAGRARKRGLIALLHLLDVDSTSVEFCEDGPSMLGLQRRAVQVLTDGLAACPPGSVRRVLCASLARSLDVAAREGGAEPSDLLLSVAGRVSAGADLLAITEASTHPDVHQPLAAYLRFVDPEAAASLSDTAGDLRGESQASQANAAAQDPVNAARRVVHLSHSLNTAGLYRGEALRQVLLRAGRCLQSIATATCLSDIANVDGGRTNPVGDLEDTLDELRQMLQGARRRVMSAPPTSPESANRANPALALLIERAASGGVAAEPTLLQEALTALVADLPVPIAASVTAVTDRIRSLPAAPSDEVLAIPLERRRVSLPDWLLPRRTIGAFYVVRALGSGGVSSVFVARRLEERHHSNARHYALKVPEYDPSTARSLSEQEFLQLFREEAGALLALPHHANLAGFVTFDLAALPKPILVMELISGTSLERLVRKRALTVQNVLWYLDGILAGLDAMHQAGLGHLDLKPSNVILRDDRTPVLVDFGLAGRKLRPGCGSLDYCAPEVLGVTPPSHAPRPQPADIYALAAMAFELFTTRLLIEGDHEMDIAAQHVSHDGWPARLVLLANRPGTHKLASVLSACLRADPRHRPTAVQVRASLRHVADSVQGLPWPLALESAEPEATHVRS